jgi:hypothetical protein
MRQGSRRPCHFLREPDAFVRSFRTSGSMGGVWWIKPPNTRRPMCGLYASEARRNRNYSGGNLSCGSPTLRDRQRFLMRQGGVPAP